MRVFCRVVQLVEAESWPIAVTQLLLERHLQDLEIAVSRSSALGAVSDGHLQLQRVRFVLVRIVGDNQVNDVLKETRDGPALILRDRPFLQTDGRHTDQHLTGALAESNISHGPLSEGTVTCVKGSLTTTKPTLEMTGFSFSLLIAMAAMAVLVHSYSIHRRWVTCRAASLPRSLTRQSSGASSLPGWSEF